MKKRQVAKLERRGGIWIIQASQSEITEADWNRAVRVVQR